MMAGDVIIRRLEPVHDPEAFGRAMEILAHGLRRGLIRVSQAEPPGGALRRPAGQGGPESDPHEREPGSR